MARLRRLAIPCAACEAAEREARSQRNPVTNSASCMERGMCWPGWVGVGCNGVRFLSASGGCVELCDITELGVAGCEEFIDGQPLEIAKMPF